MSISLKIQGLTKASTQLRIHTLPISCLSFLLFLAGMALTTPVLAQDSTGQFSQNQPSQNESSQNETAQYHARPLADESTDQWTPLSDDNGDIEIRFTRMGAGIEELILLDEYETIEGKVNIRLQNRVFDEASDMSAVPFALSGIEIDGQFVSVSGAGSTAPVWHQIAPGHFEAHIDDADGNPVVRIERRFIIRDTSHAFIIEQSIENLSGNSHEFRFKSTAMVDMPKAKNSYAGDRRRIRFGFLQSLQRQGNSIQVTVDDKLANRSKALGSRIKDSNGNKHYAVSDSVWPTQKTVEEGHRLSWIGFSDRYFSVIMHPVLDPQSTNPDDRLLASSVESINRLVLSSYSPAPDTTMLLATTSPVFKLDPGQSATVSNGVYAGPRTKPVFAADPMLASLNLPDMVVYNIGGFCAGCTFDWLTNILIAVLRIFHSMVGDWAVSIMLLVVLVRGMLHPITRWSQIRMQRFGVQMQAMAPKQKALREKYKSDPKKMQQEMSKLWKEEGISPMGMLGCLPMMLQSPVWIALYATLFFAVELKHEPAFYGIFQTISGGAWGFMNDLSSADGAIPLPSAMHFSFPLWGNVDAINVLPLLLGLVFFLHQKYLTPPTQATLTPEQESQQKMMKIMMVVLFPVMMYTAPSGLSLYFITNSAMGIVESKWIRAHMKKHGMLEIENIRAEQKDKGPSFMQRMTEAAEAKKQLQQHGPRGPNPASRQSQRKK